MTRGAVMSSPVARAVAVVAVLLLAAVVAGLSFAALQRGDAPGADASPRPVPSFSYGAGGPTASVTPSPTAIAAAPSAPGAAERMLALASEGTLWRATAGSCGTVEPLVERSTDGGASWTDVTPRYRGIGQVRALTGFAGTEAEMIADLDGTACETQWLRTFTQGRFWEPYPELFTGASYLSPAELSVMVTPGGEVEVPCATPWGLHVGSAQSTLVCDGTAQRLVAGDDEWTALAPTGVVAVDVTGPDTVVVHTDAASCPDGGAVSRVAGDGAVSSVGCVSGADLSAPVAVAALGDEVWVWAGDTVTPVAS